MMNDLKLMLADYQKANGDKAPTAIGDVMPLELQYPAALNILNNDRVVYIWGAPLKASGSAVIAYEKTVPDTGGTVLLENGTIATMSAAEFGSAPKASAAKK